MAVRSFIAAFSFAVLIAPVARAGFTSSGTLGGVGAHLANNTVYVVSSDATIERPANSPNTALYVDDGATTVLYIKKGVTLTVKGGNAQGTAGAGAGIRLNDGSTLIVTGGGKLNVTGGNAANGTSGSSGGSGWVNNDNWQGGLGGAWAFPAPAAGAKGRGFNRNSPALGHRSSAGE